MDVTNLEDFIIRLANTLKADANNVFFKSYDKNNNSIFDAEEIAEIKKDLLKADKEDKNKGFLSNNDLIAFYNKRIKQVSEGETQNKDYDKDSFIIWMQAVKNSKISNLINLTRSAVYQELSDIQKRYLQTYVVNSDKKTYAYILASEIKDVPIENLSTDKLQEINEYLKNDVLRKNFSIRDFVTLTMLDSKAKKLFDELLPTLQKEENNQTHPCELIRLAEKTSFEDLEQVKRLLESEFGEDKNKLESNEILSILKLDEQQQKRLIEVFNNAKVPRYIYPAVIEMMEIEKFLPEKFFENNPNFAFECSNDRRLLGYKTSKESPNSYLFDKNKGLVQMCIENTEENSVRIINLETGTEHIVKYADIKNKKQVLSETINKYSKIEFNNGNSFVLGDLQNTLNISNSGPSGLTNVLQTDAQGNVKVLQSSTVDNENTKSVIKNLVSPQGVKTEYMYEITQNGSQKLQYRIIDSQGNVILDKNQVIEKKSENTYLTVVNGRQYEATYNNGSLIITDKTNSNVKVFNLSDKFIPEGKDVILKILQRMPANMLIAMDKIPLEMILFDADNSEESIRQGGGGFFENKQDKLAIGNSVLNKKVDNAVDNDSLANSLIGLFTHEYGHYLDSSEDKNDNTTCVISTNKELKKIFDEELEAFLSSSNTEQQEFIDYFISTTNEERSSKERIAEGIMLLNTPNATCLETRALYYQMNFPRTIAKISEFLDERLSN